MTIDVSAARSFLRTHGRVLEIRQAEVFFDAIAIGEGGEGTADPAPVIAALEAYRNSDGGFGHALECDVLAPHSQPLHSDFAFDVLGDLAQQTDRPHPAIINVARETLTYLASVADSDGGLAIVFSDVASFPRAAHWGDGTFPSGLNPTAKIVGNSRALGLTHPWIDQAAEFCRKALEPIDRIADAHTALCALRFLETDPDQDWAADRHTKLGHRLPELEMFQPMPSKGYGLTPLVFAPHPTSPRRRFFDDTQIDAHLSELESQQQPDGGWSIPWEPPGPAAKLAWRGVATLSALRVLHAYGRI